MVKITWLAGGKARGTPVGSRKEVSTGRERSPQPHAGRRESVGPTREHKSLHKKQKERTPVGHSEEQTPAGLGHLPPISTGLLRQEEPPPLFLCQAARGVPPQLSFELQRRLFSSSLQE